jgi:hypothetical protein
VPYAPRRRGQDERSGSIVAPTRSLLPQHGQRSELSFVMALSRLLVARALLALAENPAALRRHADGQLEAIDRSMRFDTRTD